MKKPETYRHPMAWLAQPRNWRALACHLEHVLRCPECRPAVLRFAERGLHVTVYG